MARSGPVTKDTSTVALGLAQIRIGDCGVNIANIQPVLSSSDSIGALANTKYMGNTDWAELESGFPQRLDYSVVLRENAQLDCAFKEITPYNMAMAHGIDPTDGSYAEEHSGEVAIGGRSAPAYIRMEACYTYPNGDNHMYIIFPRAQVTSSVEIDLQNEEFAAAPISFKATNADSDVAGLEPGSAVWDNKPLGRIFWD